MGAYILDSGADCIYQNSMMNKSLLSLFYRDNYSQQGKGESNPKYNMEYDG